MKVLDTNLDLLAKRANKRAKLLEEARGLASYMVKIGEGGMEFELMDDDDLIDWYKEAICPK